MKALTSGMESVACDAWAEDALPMLAAAMSKSARFLYRQLPAGDTRRLDMTKVAANPFKSVLAPLGIDLPAILGSDVRFAKWAHDVCKQYPLIKAGFDRFYGPGFFRALATKIAADAKTASGRILFDAPVRRRKQASAGPSLIPRTKTAAGPAPRVEIITDADYSVVKNLPEEQKEKVLRHGYLIRDERTGKETSVVYNTQVRQTYSSPNGGGLYEVLEAPASFDRMLVLTNPQSNNGGHPFCTVVRLAGSNKAWINVVPDQVLTRKTSLDEDFREWFEKLPEKETLSEGAVYVAVDERAHGTVPFEVRKKFAKGGEGTGTIYAVNFYTNQNQDRRPSVTRTYTCDAYDTWNAKLFVDVRKGTKLRAIQGELHVPANFRFLKLKDAPTPKTDSLIVANCCEPNSASEERPIVPGNLKDVQLLFTEKTARLKVWGDEHEAWIATEKTGSQRFGWRTALFDLVRTHGLTEKAAGDVIKAATAKIPSRTPAVFRLKYAAPYPMIGPDAPPMPPPALGTEPVGYSSVNAIYPQEERLPVPGLDPNMTDPRVYDPFLPDQKALATAQAAGQRGDKEVFDVSMLGNLLKSVRQDSLVDRHLGDLMKALDSLGRLMMSFYYHQEEFADRYGQAEMPEMEDALRNSFEDIGDLVIKLRTGSVEMPDNENTDTGLEDVANA